MALLYIIIFMFLNSARDPVFNCRLLCLLLNNTDHVVILKVFVVINNHLLQVAKKKKRKKRKEKKRRNQYCAERPIDCLYEVMSSPL